MTLSYTPDGRLAHLITMKSLSIPLIAALDSDFYMCFVELRQTGLAQCSGRKVEWVWIRNDCARLKCDDVTLFYLRLNCRFKSLICSLLRNDERLSLKASKFDHQVTDFWDYTFFYKQKVHKHTQPQIREILSSLLSTPLASDFEIDNKISEKLQFFPKISEKTAFFAQNFKTIGLT